MPQDLAADSVRKAIRAVFDDSRYVWDRPRDPWAWVREALLAVQRWFAALHDTNRFLYWLILSAMILVLAAIIAHAAILVYRAFRARPVAPQLTAHLPGERKSAEWFAREAQRLEVDGRFAESLAMRFAALVHGLEERKALRVHPSHTPMEYVREASLDPERRQAFASLVKDYYRALFGRAPIDRAALAAFDAQAARVSGNA